MSRSQAPSKNVHHTHERTSKTKSASRARPTSVDSQTAERAADRGTVAVIVKRTAYRKYVLEEHDPLVTKLVRRHDPTVERIKRTHDEHEATVRTVVEALGHAKVPTVLLASPSARIPKHTSLVVTVGGDGTLLSASHRIGSGVPLIGINSAPESSIGFFCGAHKGNAARILERALSGELDAVHLSRMRVERNGELLHARVLNEALFCHESPAATSRYIIELPEGSEEQRSSGLWIGPAAGSTAAQRSAGGAVLTLESTDLQYIVREPYTPPGHHVRFARGLVERDEQVVLRSKMRDAKLFLDGHAIVHAVTLGDVITMRRSDETLTVLGIAKKRRT